MKAIKDKAKAILLLPMDKYTKVEMQVLLQWKLGSEQYSQHSKKSAKVLDVLWRLNLNVPNPPDVILPPPTLEEPTVPAIEETELRRVKQHQFKVALQTAKDYNNKQLEEFGRVIMGLREQQTVESV